MDPSIMKLLEEEEDETMHSGADVDAFTAALNRDIEGDTSSSQPPSDSNTSASLFQGSNQASGQLYSQWQLPSKNENDNNQSQQVSRIPDQQQQRPSELEVSQLGSGEESRRLEFNATQTQGDLVVQHKQTHEFVQEFKTEPNTLDFHQSSSMQVLGSSTSQIQEPDKMQSNSQSANVQAYRSQQTTVQEQANTPVNRSPRQIPFGSLLPVILPELDKDKAMQLQALYNKLRRNEVGKDSFVRSMRGLVGDQMLKLAVFKMQAKSARMAHAAASQSQSAIHQPQVRPTSGSSGHFADPYSFSQLHHMGQNTPSDPSSGHSLAIQVQKDSGHPTLDGYAQRSREMEPLSDSHAMQVSQIPDRTSNPIQGLNLIQQQHVHFTHNSLPMRASSNDHLYPATNANVLTKAVKQTQDIQKRQVQHSQSPGLTHVGAQTMNMMTVPKLEKQNIVSDSKKVTGGSFPLRASNVPMQQDPVAWQAFPSNEHKTGSLSSGPYLKREPADLTNDHHSKPLVPSSQGSASVGSVGNEQGNALSGATNFELSERQPSRMTFSASISMPQNSGSSSVATQSNNDSQMGSQIPSSGAIIGAVTTSKTPVKKPAVGQKKPLDTHGSSPPPSSKKQKVSGASLDQSIEHLNDVTAVSGVNLREEEEQLFSVPKDESRISEASRRAVQEEEERVILQKIPLQKMLAEIISKCGLKNLSNDVEQCLSLCVEERLRGLISNLIRVSKQRVDSEKSRHRTIITSDVRQQILAINRKAKEEWEKKQAESEKLRKLSDPETSSGVESDKEKDEGRGKSIKNVQPNKDEDDKMRTTAANVAARAAVGGDDMLSKWQLMAEQAKQKREGGATENASGSQAGGGKDANSRPLTTTSVKNQRDNHQGAGKRESSSAAGAAVSESVRLLGRNQVTMPPQKVARGISVHDVIAVLERESQMRKSTALYRLFERTRRDSTGE
ncbi:hypothetical protein Dimus_028046 [Dionaea muscipula]